VSGSPTHSGDAKPARSVAPGSRSPEESTAATVALQTPSHEEVRDVRPGGLPKVHGDRVVPNGATAGGGRRHQCDRTIDQVEAAIVGWAVAESRS